MPVVSLFKSPKYPVDFHDIYHQPYAMEGHATVKRF